MDSADTSHTHSHIRLAVCAGSADTPAQLAYSIHQLGAIDSSCQLTAYSPSLQLLRMHITPYLLSSSSLVFSTGLGIVACYGSLSHKFSSRHKQSM